MCLRTGLDTSSALTVMQCIRDLAKEDRIVLTSIHQPRARIWEMFDSVVVMAEGQTLYCGPTTEVSKRHLHVCRAPCKMRQYSVLPITLRVQASLSAAEYACIKESHI